MADEPHRPKRRRRRRGPHKSGSGPNPTRTLAPQPLTEPLGGNEGEARIRTDPVGVGVDPGSRHVDDGPAPEVRLLPDRPLDPPDPDGEWVFSGDDADDTPRPGVVTNVACLTLHAGGKVIEADAGDLSLARGDRVVLDAERGVCLATCAIATSRKLVRQPLRKILRLADARDLERAEANTHRAQEMLCYAKDRVRERRMPVKMYTVELASGGSKGGGTAGGSKAVFYFSSEERIDFRDLVRDFAHRFRLRVELRQTGVRDEAKRTGGIGSCGRELCCTTWLPRFDPVSIKNAKDQNLVLNPSKVSGQCGRLKCCLVYEQATYSEMRKGLPKVGKRVATPAGDGKVAEVDVLHQRVRVLLAPGELATFPASAVTVLAGPPSGPTAPPGPHDPHPHEPHDPHDDDEEPGPPSDPSQAS